MHPSSLLHRLFMRTPLLMVPPERVQSGHVKQRPSSMLMGKLTKETGVQLVPYIPLGSRGCAGCCEGMLERHVFSRSRHLCSINLMPSRIFYLQYCTLLCCYIQNGRGAVCSAESTDYPGGRANEFRFILPKLTLRDARPLCACYLPLKRIRPYSGVWAYEY